MHPVILVAASGGGTRAAVFTGAVLEGISQSNPDDILAGSGVSGGGAALAYYGAKRPDLTSSKSGAWNQFFDTMEMPFIQDVIERAAEWRMVEHGRLGNLLAESFERRWGLGSDRSKFGDLNDFGLILNTTLAGRFDRTFLTDDENRGMTLGEVATKYFDRTRSDVAGGRLILTNVNSPPPNRRWLQVTAGSRIDRPCGRLHHVEVIVWLGGLLLLDISLPDFIGHIAAGGNPIASCPQVLPPIALA